MFLLWSLNRLRRSRYSGAFDTPSAKCPPDRRVGGSSTCVTGGSARFPSSSPSASFTSSNSNKDYNFPNSIITSNSTSPVCESTPPQLQHRPLIYPLTPPSSSASLGSYVSSSSNTSSASSPVRIPTNGHGLATPPLTPESSPTMASGVPKDRVALEFLCKLFAPSHARSALPFAKSVEISSSELDLDIEGDEEGAFTFSGVVLELPGKARTLYVDGKGVENVRLRERCVIFLLFMKHLTLSLPIASSRSSISLLNTSSVLRSF